MKTGRPVFLAAIVLCASTIAAQAEEPAAASQQALAKQVEALPWVHGPATVTLGDQATVRLPKGTRYLDPQGTSKFLVMNGNPPADNEYTIAPETNGWFAVLEFDRSGFVSDKEKIDPAALFKQIKDDEVSGNEERKSLSQEPLYLDRWLVAPHYDVSTNNLEWGTVMHAERSGNIVNYTSRMLGRDGVMKAILVSDPENFTADLSQYRAALAGFTYRAGKDYQSHQEGDKMATYGLGALVAGGAAAAAAKTGLLALILKAAAAFYKIIILGALALLGIMRGRIAHLFGRGPRPDGEA